VPPRRLAAGVAVAVVLAAAAAVIGDRLISASSEPPKAKRAASADRELPRGFVRFRDRSVGFSIAHPSDWIRLPRPRADVRLLAARAGASLSVRVSTVGIEVGPDSLGPARSITDKLVADAGPIKLVRNPEQIAVGGLPGYLYLYTFRDADTKQTGVHAHYFLFRGNQLYALVFQALPAATFGSFTRTFDAIAETLRVSPPRDPAVPGI
jgi:hypothetical protein